MGKISGLVMPLAEAIAADQGVEIWDVEYVKEGGDRFLRVYLDHKDGVSIDMCESFSRALEKRLDELDPIEEAYILEISSPGIERELRRPRDFDRFMGERVRVKLYRVEHGARVHEGRLSGYSGDGLVITADSGDELRFELSAVAKVNIAFIF